MSVAHVVNLRAGPITCEYRENPLGIDTPLLRLSWRIETEPSARGIRQKAYRVLVASSAETLARDEGDFWDSGVVESDQSHLVTYRGRPLDSHQRGWWKVRIWTTDGNPTSWSKPAFWQMAITNPAEWRAQWIAVREAPENDLFETVAFGDWIWHPTHRKRHSTMYFRRTFTLDSPARVTVARLKIAADHGFVLYVNGEKLGERTFTEFPGLYDVRSPLHADRPNLVAVEVHDETLFYGLIAGLRIEFEDGRVQELVSDSRWLASEVLTPGWIKDNVSTKGWVSAKVLGEYGMRPWHKFELRRPVRSTYLRREFDLLTGLTRATAYVTGLGLYDFYVNGRRVGDDTLTPGYTHFPERVEYQTYDITEYLTEGKNAVVAILGNGWFSSGMPANRRDGYLRFLAQIHLGYGDANDRHEVVVTDGSWKAHESPILEDGLYNGETCDARLELDGWCSPDFDDSAWRPVIVLPSPTKKLVAQAGPPIRATEERAAIGITEPSPGVFIFDFGQNFAGRCRLKVSGPAGTRVRIRHGEILRPDGTLYVDNLIGARATDVYILKGNRPEVWEPRFTYHGFRYAELTGYPGLPTREVLIARVIHTAAPVIGDFECSNELVNRIHRNLVWTQRSNMHSVPTDCPQRDERLGWLGDTQAFARTACWNFHLAPLYTKWLGDIRDSQSAEGYTTNYAPTINGKPAAPGWGDAIVIVPWTLYQFYGDRRVIEENYDRMAAWIEYMRRNAPDDLYEHEGFGDWMAIVESPTAPIGAAYFYYSTKLLAEMAEAVGRRQDADIYTQLARDIAGAFNRKFLNLETNDYLGRTQTAKILPLYFGITPPDRRPAVFHNLVNDIVERDYHTTCGFLGAAYLMPLLAHEGAYDVAFRLLTRRTHPSWGYMVERGATTVWERWNSDEHERREPGKNSFNHYAFGAVGQWFFEELAGLKPDTAQPGFKHFLIQPRPIGDLTYARAEHLSPYGTIRSAWQIRDRRLTISVQVPGNATATVCLPATTLTDVQESDLPVGATQGVTSCTIANGIASVTVGSGDYTFSAPWRD
ncbi:MAG: family 78 glycoside hydrolase catalytic domain [Candidatus Hydrogenedentes bacterium]|nr:family 78 glycoside hydrolase catalytic domain [Candidatus Hydrogenedentota bacterium]